VDLSAGEFMKVMRERVGLTQRQLAEILGKSDQAVSDWERGKSVPSLTPPKMLLLCKTLGISLDELADHFEAN
jgi:transcriptional regulator with XRE-family HTH domain